MQSTGNSTNRQDAARDYLLRGYAPLPTPHRKKKPVLDDWQNLRVTDEDIERYFKGAGNIGVLLGEPSGWLLDVDLDHALAVELADLFLPATASEFGRASKPRSHRLYIGTAPCSTYQLRLPKGPSGKAPMVVELRSTGAQTIFPPSIRGAEKPGEKDEPIQWHNDGTPTRIDPAELKACIDALFAEVLRRLGLSERRTSRPPTVAGDQRFTPISAEDARSRAQRYISRIDGAISGDGGHDQTFTVACALVLGFGLSPDEAYPLLDEYNQRCQPQWASKDLWHKLHDADKKPGPRGYKLTELPSRQLNGHVNNGASLSPPLATTTKVPQESPGVSFSRITSAELATGKFEINYLIDRILAEGQPCILAGPKKSLKTTIIVALAIALVRAVDFLRRFKVASARRVLVMSGESGVAVLQETAKRICRWHDCDLAGLDNLIWSVDLPQIAMLDHLDALRQMLIDDEIEVLIVDPAYLCLPCDDVTNLFAMGGLLGNLSRTCRDCGVTMVLVHHCRKGVADPFGPPELENIAFAGFQEFARQWILTGRREVYEPGSGSHRLWLSSGGSAGHSGLWALDIEEGGNTAAEGRTFDCAVTSADAARSSAQRQKDQAKAVKQREAELTHRQKIIAVLTSASEALTKNDLRTRTSLSMPKIDGAIANLLENEQVEVQDVAKPNRKKPYEGFALTPHERRRIAEQNAEAQRAISKQHSPYAGD